MATKKQINHNMKQAEILIEQMLNLSRDARLYLWYNIQPRDELPPHFHSLDNILVQIEWYARIIND